MTTLLSSNQEKSHQLINANSYELKNNSRIIVAGSKEVVEATRFLEENGFGGVYFDPAGDVSHYEEWGVSMKDNSEYGILEFYN